MACDTPGTNFYQAAIGARHQKTGVSSYSSWANILTAQQGQDCYILSSAQPWNTLVCQTLAIASQSEQYSYLYRIAAAESPNRTMASSTKRIGEDAENGINERITGYHTFVIQKPSTITADGLLVGVTRHGQLGEEKTEKSTGAAGWDVEFGDRVRVFNVNVVVKPR
ncbi:uncharacterized protein FMAN_02072 [Fusarium mangiferae]|uniref:Uncharacterized protein n=1 Tax=Fusarium mangiferae TaxID=192010 RepID=A0A1L7SHP2_FUSMA|nr:uncharacterized protein FMAN_02072 [Fusarium mangiferae]CVK85170.1 uncharacterized protein FMAN_02072 [Fusarium mangiferae]